MTDSPASDFPDILDGPYDGLLFDLDGVITNTATLHAAAWKRTFDDLLNHRAVAAMKPFVPFDLKADYLTFVDGKPIHDGVRDFLTSRNITLPEGHHEDAPSDNTLWAIGNLKSEYFMEALKAKGVDIYEDTVAFIRAARERSLKIAVVSSSAHTAAILDEARLTELFDVRVDGISILEQHLRGKPAPDTFLEGARQLDVDPKRAVVFEDALAGVAAGKAGGFGLVVGVDRGDHADALRANGADIVVQGIGQLL